MTMRAGKYYIGDLCYAMHGEWDEVCGLIVDDERMKCLEGEFTLKDGRKFAMFSTAYGDGEYPDNEGHSFPVDSGSLGCILLEDIDRTDAANSDKFGAIVDFPEDFEVASERDGTVYFGHLAIRTGAEVENDYCY